MKALLSRAPGGPQTLVLEEVEEPVPGEDELLVSVAACGVNYPDVLVIEDRYQFKPPRPFSPGSEISGTVIGVGAKVTGWQPGDRVIATSPGSGGMAERAVVKAIYSFHLPDGFDFVPSAALLLTYATAIHGLKDRGRLAAGETLLVLGAAGGVGLATVEVGKALGARVIAAVSSEEKARAARSAGADDVLIYPGGPLDKEASRELANRFKAIVGPGGADVILDPVGGDYADPALRCIAWKGRYLVVGFPAGIPSLPFNLFLMKGCEVAGVFQGAFAEREPEANAANVAQLFEWWSKGRIQPVVSEIYPLARGNEAIAHLAGRAALGKLVVQIST